MIRRGDAISAAGALVLAILMFGAAWYGVVALPGRATSSGRISTENGWYALTVVRWAMLLTIVVAVGSLLLHATQREHGTQTATGAWVAVLGTLTAALLVYRVLIALPTPDKVVDQKLGAVLGLLSALAIALGGYTAMREERSSAKRFVKRSRTR